MSDAVDVKAMRKRLGMSRVVFARVAGVSAGSIDNWERGKPISPANIERLRSLEDKVAKGEVKPGKKGRGGRRKKGAAVEVEAAAPKRRGRRRRGSNVEFSGEASTAYANVVSITRTGHDARIRFGLQLTDGDGAKLVADVVVPLGLLRDLG